MSTGYGKYLTEEDPNKKKPEGTTPSATATTPTTGTTAPGGTTTPPLGIDGFVGTGTGSNAYQTNVGFYNDQYNTAVDAAKTNKDLGMEYIEGVKNSIYGNAAAQRAEADKNTEVARQRGIIDSQSSYQKAVGAYGSNAETLAGRGLSGSGYGEYLTADAYATHRGQVQNINADALRANREAAYTEKQAQMAADSEYLKNLYGINTEYNNAMNKAESDRTTGMYQAALGLNKAQNTAYGKLFDSASKGVSIDAIMQDGTWGALTPEQQQVITAEAERIANEQAEADMEAKITSDADRIIESGGGLDELNKIENFDKLSPDRQAAYIQAASDNTIASMVTKGASLEEIMNSEAWKTASSGYKTQVEAAYEQEESFINDQLQMLSRTDEEGNRAVKSLSDLNAELDSMVDADGKYLSKRVKDEIRSRWINANVDGDIEVIGSASFENGKLMLDGEEISASKVIAGIKAGLYGDRKGEVVKAFAEAWVRQASSEGASTMDILNAMRELKALGDYGEHYYNKIKSKVTVRDNIPLDSKSDHYEIYGIKFEKNAQQINTKDNELVDALDTIAPKDKKSHFVRIGNDYYYTSSEERPRGRVWYKLKKTEVGDTTTDKTPVSSNNTGGDDNPWVIPPPTESGENATSTDEQDDNGESDNPWIIGNLGKIKR